MTILKLMLRKDTVAYLYDDFTLRQGLEKMKAHGYTAIPVIRRDGSYAGTVSEGDFLWHMVEHGSSDIRVQEDFLLLDIMRREFQPPVKISASTEELMMRVMDQNFVPVVDDRGIFMGIVTRKDIIRYFMSREKDRQAEIE